MTHRELAEAYMGKRPRVDMKTTGASKRTREDLVTTEQLERAARARKAGCSVQGSGGGESAPASSDKGSLRATLYAAAGMDR